MRTKKSNGAVTFYGYGGHLPVLLELEAVRIVFEPDVFGGDGAEKRKNICFAGVSAECLEKIRGLATKIEGQVSSAIKGDLLRCKFTPSATFVYDTMSAHTDAPQFWRNWTVNAMGRLGSLVFCHRGPQPPRRWVGVSLGSEGLRTGTWQALSPESYGGSCEIRGEA